MKNAKVDAVDFGSLFFLGIIIVYIGFVIEQLGIKSCRLLCCGLSVLSDVEIQIHLRSALLNRRPVLIGGR